MPIIKISEMDAALALTGDEDVPIVQGLENKRVLISDIAAFVRYGNAWKQPVEAASTGPGTLATAFENGDTLDGVSLTTGMRILIKDQSAGAENGIYTVEATGAPTRALDFDDDEEVAGAIIKVKQGTANADTIWKCTNNTATVGSTALVFAQQGAVDSVNGQTGDVSLNGGYLGVEGADIASAGTVDLAAATGDFVDVTGTTTITALGTLAAGIFRVVRFTGVLTLTHNGTSLILPTGANITTAAGDVATFRSLGSGNWVCVGYQRASGAPLVGGGSAGTAPVITESGTTYDVDAADDGSYIRFTNTAAKTVTVRDESDHALPANGEWHLRNVGANDLTLVEDTAVTINVPAGGTLVLEPGMTVTLKRVTTDEFDLFGQTVAA